MTFKFVGRDHSLDTISNFEFTNTKCVKNSAVTHAIGKLCEILSNLPPSCPTQTAK